jgi:hypothetical protein
MRSRSNPAEKKDFCCFGQYQLLASLCPITHMGRWTLPDQMVFLMNCEFSGLVSLSIYMMLVGPGVVVPRSPWNVWIDLKTGAAVMQPLPTYFTEAE